MLVTDTESDRETDKQTVRQHSHQIFSIFASSLILHLRIFNWKINRVHWCMHLQRKWIVAKWLNRSRYYWYGYFLDHLHTIIYCRRAPQLSKNWTTFWEEVFCLLCTLAKWLHWLFWCDSYPWPLLDWHTSHVKIRSTLCPRYSWPSQHLLVFLGQPFVKRLALCYQTVVCPVCL